MFGVFFGKTMAKWEACSIGLFDGIKCETHGPVLSHFMYADDVIFIGEWSSRNALNLNRILRCFYLVSGLRVNLSKSSIYGVGVDEGEVHAMASILRCKIGSFPFKHLGLQVGANMNLVKNWKPVVDIFKKRLSVWKASTLSYGGRITLIKSVLSALPTYYFSLYKAPMKVIKQLERLRKDFLWGSDPEHEKMSWVAWQRIMAPIELGGVGIWSLKEANTALLAKWWWRFKVDGPCLWRNVIWNLHSSSRNWCDIPVRLSAPGIWKQVAGISKDLLDVGVDLPGLIRGIPGDGLNILFWKDHWVMDKPLQFFCPNLFRLEKLKNSPVASRVRVVDGITILNFEWTREPGSAEELLELEGLMAVMGDVYFGSGRDMWEWKADQSGTYSVRSLRLKMQLANYPDREGGFIWDSWAPIKVKFLSWCVFLNRIPTMVELQKRNINTGSLLCRICGNHDETTDHLFVSCDLAQGVWDYVSRWCRIPSVYAFEFKDLVKLHHHMRGS
ncbi:putative RNA-directed DNA polymerase [Helianthus annuus]|nr:putative RNA-directed DNA polymerase [Helianthus annuus]KAJ0574889.1 putative RNA-directed DNA polymerase [Helianthus annuus]KAJ0739219.1 putative RNA-directed DNA polymerase [Helianthus annuus]